MRVLNPASLPSAPPPMVDQQGLLDPWPPLPFGRPQVCEEEGA